MNGVVQNLVAVAVAIVGLAMVAVLVSRNAQTPQVIGAAGNAFSGSIAAALSPVAGSPAASTGGFSLVH